MKFDFDSFEFAGLIAPGSIIVLAVVLLEPQLLLTSDSTYLIAMAIVAAYVIGHLVAAVANVAEPLFRLAGIRDLESLSDGEWESLGFIASDQEKRFETLVTANLHRQFPLDEVGSTQRKTVIKQMYIAVQTSEIPERLTTFSGLYNLSRGLCVLFLICVIMTLVAQHYLAALLCTAAAGLALYRAEKFKRSTQGNLSNNSCF